MSDSNISPKKIYETYQMIEIVARATAADLWSRIDRETVIEHYGRRMGSSPLALAVTLARRDALAEDAEAQ